MHDEANGHGGNLSDGDIDADDANGEGNGF